MNTARGWWRRSPGRWVVTAIVFAIGFVGTLAYAAAAREANRTTEQLWPNFAFSSRAILDDLVPTEDGPQYVVCDWEATAWLTKNPSPGYDGYSSYERAESSDEACAARRATGPDLTRYTQTGTPTIPIPAGSSDGQVSRGHALDQVGPDDRAWAAVDVEGGKIVVECTTTGAIISDDGAVERGEMGGDYTRVRKFDQACSASTNLTVWTPQLLVEVDDA